MDGFDYDKAELAKLMVGMRDSPHPQLRFRAGTKTTRWLNVSEEEVIKIAKVILGEI